ncbi:MAG: NAD(P)-dependent oxidoreductase [Vicinamibacterales bacterium]
MGPRSLVSRTAAEPILELMETSELFTAGQNDRLLVTGATGFIGSRVVASLLERGFRNIRCFARPSSDRRRLEELAVRYPDGRLEFITGNLLSREDCVAAARDVTVVYHLAAGTGQKSFPDAFMNSVVTTRNLIEASVAQKSLRRLVTVSSFAVYANGGRHGHVLDETCPLESQPELRGEAYCFAKVRQEELVAEYGRTSELPYVIVRPGYVYGPGKQYISDRVGIDTFGVFLHLGGGNTLPLTYVDNCADAIAMAGLTKGIEGGAFNVVDDDLPSSRQFLREYKRAVRRFPSIYVPHAVSYALCRLWEGYSRWSMGQLPPAFNRRRWDAYWKKTAYSNSRLKTRVGWTPRVSTTEGLRRFFSAQGESRA